MYSSFCNLLSIIAILSTVSASPILQHRRGDAYTLDYNHWNSLSARKNDKPLLRVLPLGASMTKGGGDTPKDNESGYRRVVRESLRSKGYPVNMVGCSKSGEFQDNEHEGHSGARVDEMKGFATCSMPFKPNLVLLNAGTNDAVFADDHGGIPFLEAVYDRMKDVLEYIYKESDGVTIILSTLLPNKNNVTDGRAQIINRRYRQLVEDLSKAGRKIELADMHAKFPVDGLGGDGAHPNHEGYPKMAAIWLEAFDKVASKGWITKPIDNGDNGVCLPNQGPVKTSEESGEDDGVYSYNGSPKGSLAKESHSSSILKNFHFAQLVGKSEFRGQETDELIRVLDENQRGKLPYVSYKLNNGGNLAKDWTTIDVKKHCPNAGVHWGDINGDGLDDFICISEVSCYYGTPFVQAKCFL